MIVELHILQNFAPSCLNRDDTNAPKECEFGGVRRARISSQCIKRTIRTSRIFSEMLHGYLSSRSVRFPNQVFDELCKLGVAEDIAKEIGKGLQSIAKKERGQTDSDELVSDDISGKKGKKAKEPITSDTMKTPQMIFFPYGEVQACASNIKTLLDAGKKPEEILEKAKTGKYKNLGVLPVPNAADIGLFGRMVTSDYFMNVDAACQVAHAISTHKVGREFDFYTAVDDLRTGEETGAGMMGDIEFNSACYYRYANIDVEQLRVNVGDKELAKKAVEAFLMASIDAIPSGKQTSFSTPTPPEFVFAVVRHGGAWSLANAFSRPVKPVDDIIADSIDALVGYWEKLIKAYGNASIVTKSAIALRGRKFDALEQVENISKLVKRTKDAIELK